MITDEQYQGLRNLRSSIVGRDIRFMLQEKLEYARADYEDNTASEGRRQLVLAYRTALDVLFHTRAEDL